ncbi:MAG: hypothetical protein JST68_13840 [Bacteroidetes bacterium]|nr:hypothetical protein [Bacteroidota bacterium]
MIRQDTTPLPWKVVLPVLVIYGVISAVGLSHHELFLDEAHHFLLARDSHSLSELYWNARYDGHPRLWHSLLYFITHYITRSPYGMQVFHWLIVVGAAFVFLRHAPFSLAVKLLVLMGYYFLFEYNLISRNYSLGICLLFCCCVLLARPVRPLVGLGVLLFFMCSTHVFYTFAAMGIYLGLLIEYGRVGQVFRRSFLVLSGLFWVGFVFALIQAHTPVEDNVNMGPVNARGFLSSTGLSFASFGLVRGWLPIPQHFDGHFWNRYWLYESFWGGLIRTVLFVFFLGFPYLVLRRSWRALVFYYTTVSLLLLFFSVTMMTASRYFGMVFVFFLAALWMAGAFGMKTAPVWVRGCFYGILGIQAVVGVFAWVQDFRLPFSESRNAVTFLKERDGVVVVDGYNIGPMLCAYTEGKVYYLATGAEGSFCVWKKEYFPRPRPSIAQELAGCSGLPESFVLVTNRELGEDGGAFRLMLLKSFTNSIIGENFFIYQLSNFRKAQ